jgi:hypothetical protein
LKNQQHQKQICENFENLNLSKISGAARLSIASSFAEFQAAPQVEPAGPPTNKYFKI